MKIALGEPLVLYSQKRLKEDSPSELVQNHHFHSQSSPIHRGGTPTRLKLPSYLRAPTRFSTNKHPCPQPPEFSTFRIKNPASETTKSGKSGKSVKTPKFRTRRPESFIRSPEKSSQCGRTFPFSSFHRQNSLPFPNAPTRKFSTISFPNKKIAMPWLT